VPRQPPTLLPARYARALTPAPYPRSPSPLQSELNDWLLHPPEGCRLLQFEPLMQWVVEIAGPDDSPFYRGAAFRLRVAFTDRYPLEPPEFVFLTPVPVHPHIYSNGKNVFLSFLSKDSKHPLTFSFLTFSTPHLSPGHICLDILYDTRNGGWSPALTINKVALSLRSMLASATEARKPPGDAEYCSRSRGKSPKDTRWDFEDDKV
jgi:ubiquitin-protein ligase